MKWTPDQERGVRSLGKSILMSAAAGSGKTAVLAGRCVHLVCEAKEPCSVEELLVVTFTNRAADQMRERIAGRLEAKLGDVKDSPGQVRMRRELALLPRAAISTLASFCVSVLRRHFHAAGVDPRFAVLDADEARLLKRQTVRELFEARFEAEDEDFIRLVDLYADGNDLRLRERVVDCWEMLTSVIDPARWRRTALERLREAAGKPLNQSDLGGQWIDVIDAELVTAEAAALECRRVVGAALASEPTLGKLAAWVEQFVDEAADWRRLLRSGGLDVLARRVAAFDPGVKPRVQRPINEAYGLEAPIKALRDAMGKDVAPLLATPEATWRRIMAQLVVPTEQFLALVEAFDAEYSRAKAAIRALDFSDLERKTLELLQDPHDPARPSEIALAYRRRFAHVLVDEFQDINAMQARLLALLSREDAVDPSLEPNLFTVGDVKQSIYRFRLADPEMFLERARLAAEQAGTFDRIDLQQNFRSRGPLLEAINSVFMRLLRDEALLEIDYADRHQLIGNPAYPPAPDGGFPGAPIEIHVLDPASGAAAEGDGEEDGESTGAEVEWIEREAAFIAERIRQFRVQGRQIVTEGGEVQPLRFAHVAVLLRSLKFNSERMVRMLRQLGVPARSEVGSGFFEALEIRDMVSLLHVLDNRRQDIPLAAVLRSPLVKLEHVEDLLVRIRLWASRKPWLRKAPFFEAVLAFAESAETGARQLRAALARIDEWRRIAYRKPLADLLWQIYTDSGYLAYVEGLPDGLQRSRNLLELHRRAGSFDRFQRRGLGAFMEFLENLQEGSDLAQPPVLGAGEDAVRIMSVHAAKGLEFPVVFLADCGREHNRRDLADKILIDRELGVALPGVDERHGTWFPSIPRLLAQRRIDRLSLAEELRVLYVAMTRAREHLVCVGTTRRSGSRTAADVVAAWAASAQSAGSGPLPVEAVLKGRSFLEWLCTASADRPGEYTLDFHDEMEIEGLLKGRERRAGANAVDARWTSCEDVPVAPIEEVTPTAADARKALERLTVPYRFAGMTVLPAAAGVTTLVKDPAPAPAPAEPSLFSTTAPAAVKLERPRCVAPRKASAAETGTAMHVALRLLDFARAATLDAVERQVAQMVERHQLAPDAAAALDRGALFWIAATWVGEAARERRTLWRELPIRLPSMLEEDGDAAPLDRLLVRGQIDLAIDAAAGPVPGWWLVDYKTDRVEADGKGSGRSVAALAEQYRPQLELYARGLAQISGRPVTRMGLALLSARKMVDISLR